jgi:F-type H+-transporting ATPase subunit b
MAMNALLLLTEAEGGGQIGQLARTFGVDWPHLLAQIVSFAIVCALLYLFAYKPVLKMLATRRELIAQGLANSEKIKAELAKTEAQRQHVLVQANVEATRVLEEARAAAARLRAQEIQKANVAADQIIAKAREATASDHTRMLGQLKREVGRLVVQTTVAITGKILTTEDQRRLAEETARQLTTR